MKKLVIIIFILIYSNVFAQSNNHSKNYYEKYEHFQHWLKQDDNFNKRGWKWYQRKLWLEQFQIYPNGSYLSTRDEHNIYKEIESIKFLNKQEILQQASWEPVGPDLIAKSYDTISGHGIGRVNCIAFHPQNKDIFWIGTPNGGVWKTYNSGQNWLPLTDNLPSIQISSITVDPTNPDILYIATGDIETAGWYRNGNAKGIFKSTDGGFTWESTGLSYTNKDFNYSYIRKIIIHPENTNNLIAAGSQGVWISTDAGQTWKTVLDSLFICDLKQDPSNPEVLYMASQYFNFSFSIAGIFKSTDFGKTWIKLNTQIPETKVVSRIALDVSPANPDYLYAITVLANTNGLFAIFRSTDGGITWESPFNVLEKYNLLGWYDGAEDDQGGQGRYDLVILCDKDDEKKVYVGGVNIWCSEDAGENWEIASLWMNTFGKSAHADQHYATYNPIDSFYYFCNDGGIYRTKQINPGKKEWITDWIDKKAENLKPDCPGFTFPTKWENISNGLVNTEFYRLGLCKNFSGYVTAGAQDNSCYYLNNDEWINYITNYDGMETMINHNNPEIIYGASQFGRLCISFDGGKTMINNITEYITNNNGERGDWVTSYAMDPQNTNIIYAGYKNLWVSQDSGFTWSKALDFKGKNEITSNINTFAISEDNNQLICVSKPNRRIWKDSIPHEFWLTTDKGLNWVKLRDGIPIDSSFVNYIDITGDGTNRIYLAFSTGYQDQKVYYSGDLGKSWINISKNLPNLTVYCVLHYDFSEDNVVFVATSSGVWFTSDSLDSWFSLSDNLPNCRIMEFEIQYKSNELYAATYGRGIWKTDLDALVTYVEESNYKPKFNLYPNPNNGKFVIDLPNITDKDYPLQLNIIDIFGKKVYSKKLYQYSNSISISNLHLSSGTYYLKIQYSDKSIIKKFVVVK